MCTGVPVHHEQTLKKQVARPGNRMRRVSIGTPVNHSQTIRLSRKGTPRQAGDYTRSIFSST